MSLFSLPAQRSLFVPVDSLERAIIDNGLDDLVYTGGGAGPQNLYHSVGVYGAKPARGRGRARDIVRAPGVWLDCDVKFGAFSSEADIHTFIAALDSADMAPHIVVKTGPGGGHHLYWRTETPVMGSEAISEAAQKMWLYASELAGTGIEIDRLCDPNRVMRLPGSLWWPKDGKGVGSGGSPVVLLRRDDRGVLRMADLNRASESGWREWTRARTEAMKRRRMDLGQVVRDWGADEDISEGGGGGGGVGGRWKMLARLESWEAQFNESVSWEQILVPAGWVCTGGPDAEGRMSWRRPVSASAGAGEGSVSVNPRSLVTDWVESPHVAKLMSDSPDTGLAHLEKAGLPMTKLNVMAALYFANNTHETLIRWYKARKNI